MKVQSVEGALQASIGANLRRLRRSRGTSQEKLGAEIGLHRTYVGALERAERNLSLTTVERWSEQLGVHPLDLLYDHETMAIVRGPDGNPRFVQRREGGEALRAADRPANRGPLDRGSRPPGEAGPRRPRPRPN